jgi:hypothetical protein
LSYRFCVVFLGETLNRRIESISTDASIYPLIGVLGIIVRTVDQQSFGVQTYFGPKEECCLLNESSRRASTRILLD